MFIMVRETRATASCRRILNPVTLSVVERVSDLKVDGLSPDPAGYSPKIAALPWFHAQPVGSVQTLITPVDIMELPAYVSFNPETE